MLSGWSSDICGGARGGQLEGWGYLSRSWRQYREMGKHEEAMAELEEGLRIMRSTKGERSADAGTAFGSIGDALFDQGKVEEAREKLEEAHSILKEAVGTED